MANLAIVAIVRLADKCTYPEHGYFADGYVGTHCELATIIEAEREAERLNGEAPLADGLVYEAMHKMC